MIKPSFKEKLVSFKDYFGVKLESIINVFFPFVSNKTRHYILQEIEITKRYLESELSQKLSWVARCVSHIGDGPLYALMIIIFLLNGLYEQVIVFSIGYLIGGWCFVFVKNKAKRDRPFNVSDEIKPFKVPLDEYSFPSGHTTMAFLTASMLASFYPEWGVGVYALALGIGLSRFALGVHYLTDVFCGAVIGYTIGKIIVLVVV